MSMSVEIYMMYICYQWELGHMESDKYKSSRIHIGPTQTTYPTGILLLCHHSMSVLIVYTEQDTECKYMKFTGAWHEKLVLSRSHLNDQEENKASAVSPRRTSDILFHEQTSRHLMSNKSDILIIFWFSHFRERYKITGNSKFSVFAFLCCVSQPVVLEK